MGRRGRVEDTCLLFHKQTHNLLKKSDLYYVVAIAFSMRFKRL